MRIALAGFNLESVSFLAAETTIADFEETETRGMALLGKFRGTNTVMGGFVDVCEEAGYDIVPIVQAEAGARGPAEDAAFDHYLKIIVDGLKAEEGRLDGVLLHLHGALTTPTRTDPDGEIVAAVRATLGPSIPVMLALDYHGNLDARTIAGADATFGYHYSPHTDMGETGRRAARCLVRTLRGEIKPVTSIARPGLMVPSILSATTLQPLAGFVERSIALPTEDRRIVDVSVFAGFSYADVPNCGFSVVVVCDGDMALARSTAARLSDAIHEARHDLYKRGFAKPLDEGIDHALSRVRDAAGPVVILEHADRMNDSTHVLRELLRRGATKVAVPYLWDAETARAACEIGAGGRARLSVAGKSDARAGGPVEMEADIVWAGPKSYRATGPMGTNSLVDLGLAAVLKANGITIIVTERPETAIDEDPFLQFGLEARDYDIVVLRSKTHFRAAWEPLAAEIVIVDTPDWGPADLLTLPYRHVPRNIFPFNETAR